VALELSGFRPAPLIGHRDDLNGRVGDAVDHGVKTPKKKFSRAVQIPRPAFGGADFTHGMIEFRDESRSCQRIAFGVPEEGGSSFRGRVGVNVNAWTSHGTARQSDDARRTTQQFSLSPCPDRRCGARSPCSTLPPHPRPPVHLSFPANDRPAQHALRQEDVALLVKPFCGWGSCNRFYISRSHQHKFGRGHRLESDKTNRPSDAPECVGEGG